MRSNLAGLFASVCLLFAAPAAADVTVYGDSLAPGWLDYSWATTNLASTSPVHGGTKAIAVSAQPFTALFLHSDTPITVAGTDQLSFWVYGGVAQGQLMLQLNNNVAYQKLLAIPPNAWTHFTVSFSELSFSGALNEFWLQEYADQAMAFSVDDVVLLAAPAPPPPGPALSVNAAAARRPISADIYGMNYADEALAAELRLPVRRWGGNATSRYNYLNDMSNHGSDYFFENIPQGPGANLPDGSAANLFIDQDRRTATRTLMTVPLTGWVAKRRKPDHPFDCGFKVSIYGAQTSVDPFDTDCGSGVNGAGNIAGNNPLDTSVAIDPSFVTGWVNYLKNRYGTAAAGGVRFYNLDNEPAIWNFTHRDVHPQPLTYDELRDRTIAYGAAVKAGDATARTLGPAEYGWCGFFFSAADPGGCSIGPDRQAHGNLPIIDWYLQQMRAYEQANGLRVLDYLDLHYYPQATGVTLSPAGDAATQARRLRSTRSLWDPGYADESWIPDIGLGPIRFLPRMRDWVANNYPGTKLAITEYNWGGLEHINGALAQADVLGIFGREGLDLATMWDPPTAAQPGAFAFRMYRNYDGAGRGFGDTSVQAASTDQGQLAVYAAQRSGDSALTIMVLNKTGGDIASSLALAGFAPGGPALVYRYGAASLAAIQRVADQPVTASGFSATFPANSITLYVVPSGTLEPKSHILWQKTTGRTAMWLMNGPTQVGGREFFGDGTGWAPKLTGDFNGDGQVDVLFERSTDKATAIWLLNGTTQIGGALLLGSQPVGAAWRAKYVADFDGDGKADILWEKDDGTTAIWLMDGTVQRGGGVILAGGTGWRVKLVGDFNADGKTDLLWEHTDGSSALWIMNGTTQVGGGRLFAGGSGWFSTKVADLTGDGKADILWTHTDGRVAVWIMNGAAQVGGAVLRPAATGFAIVGTGDINGDGRADIVWAKADGTTEWWAMNGTAQVGGGPIFAAGAGQAVKRVADFNGDRRRDLLLVNGAGDTSMAIFNGATFDLSPVLAGMFGYAPVVVPE